MSWIKPKPADQSLLSLILITVGFSLLAAFILFLPDYLAVACTLRIHYLFVAASFASLLWSSPFSFLLPPLFRCLDGLGPGIPLVTLDVCPQPHTSTILFCPWCGSVTPCLSLLSCTDSHTLRVGCKSKQIRQKHSDQMDFFGFQVMLWGPNEAFDTQHAT